MVLYFKEGHFMKCFLKMGGFMHQPVSEFRLFMKSFIVHGDIS